MQHRNWLKQKYQAIFGYTGLICAIAGMTILFPLIALIIYSEETELAWGFLIPGLCLTVIGWLCWCQTKSLSQSNLTVQDGTIIVVLSWILAIAFGTIPFITISGLNFTQAFFESTVQYLPFVMRKAVPIYGTDISG